MLLQKPGWRIKNLVSSRKTDGVCLRKDRDGRLDEDFEVGKHLSWSSSVATEHPLRTSNKRIPHQQPPHLGISTRSSASSLCSCECEGAVNRNAPLSLLPARKLPDVLYSSSASANNTSEDGKPRRIIFSDQRSSHRVETEYYSTKKISAIAESTFNLLEALSFRPMSTEVSVQNKEQDEFSGFSPNVEKLNREIDKAFRAVGEALAGSIAQGERWSDTDLKIIEQEQFSGPPCIPQKNPNRLIAGPEYAMAIPVVETKLRSKKTIKKKKRPVLRPSKAPLPACANATSRWTLNDVTNNVVDVFSGKKFRTEADEMLTPDRLEETKRKLMLGKEKRISAESALSAKSTDTGGSSPIEPFHLESLSELMNAAQKNDTNPPIPSRIPPAIPTSLTSPVSPLTPQNITQDRARKGEPTVSGPRNASSRPMRLSPTRTTSLLPTISEILPAPSAKNTSRNSTTSSTLTSKSHCLLPSTQYTLHAPSYRQGQIRVERLPAENKDCLSPEKEQLDWTAFQIALSGTNDGLPDICVKEEQAEFNEIAEWWTSYGFGCGSMNTANTTTPKPKSAKTIIPPPTIHSLRRAPINRNTNGGTQKFSLGSKWRKRNKEGIDTDKIISKLSSLELSKRASFAESLPQSPMLEIKIPPNSRNQDIIPMGFNLQHDIGDFLNWETHHVKQTLI